MNDEQKPEPIQTEIVYAGIRLTTKGKKAYAYERIGDARKEYLFDKALTKAGIGDVLQVWETEKSVYMSGQYAPIYLRRHDNRIEVLEWTLEDQKAKDILAFNEAARKRESRDNIAELLPQIEEVSKHLTRTQKRALLAKIAELLYL